MRSTCAGHVEKMGDEKLAKRADALKVERKWRRGRPKLRWGIALSVTKNEWEKNEKTDRYKELETVARERSKRKVRGRQKTIEK